MKTAVVSLLILWLTIFFFSVVYARNIQLILPIAAALDAKDVPDRPTGAVKFFFGSQPTPKIVAKIGSYIASPKTGAAYRSEERACVEALLWTLVALEKRAKQAGANAVVNIVSFYRKIEMSSPTQFECHVGNVIASVVLKGDMVRIADE